MRQPHSVRPCEVHMTITKLQNGDAVTLQVDGRVDTNTSPELQKAILEAFQSAKKLTLDLEKVV